MAFGKPNMHMWRMKLDPHLSPCTKLISKCLKNLSERLETSRLLEENDSKIKYS